MGGETADEDMANAVPPPAPRVPAGDDPFAAFDEWQSREDTDGYANL